MTKGVIAMDEQTKQVLVAILEAQKRQALLSGRLLGWLVAIGDTIRQDAVLEARLKENPYYHQATTPPLHTIDAMIQNIDELIQRLSQPQ
jgi:hypothetical protein